MTTTRRPLTTTDLAPLARAALGPSRTLTGVERLRGGTPDPGRMREIAEHNLHEALSLLKSAS